MVKFYETEMGHRILNKKFWPNELKNYLLKENDYLKNLIKKNSIILDVGCGEGRHLKLLAKISIKLFGIDYCKSMIDNARKELSDFDNVELFLEDASKTHFQNNYFNCSLCMFNTFGNIPKSKQKLVLNELKRVTKRKGIIVISVYSENAKEIQKKFYKNIGLTIGKEDSDFVYTKKGFKSERFSEDKLIKLFNSLNLKAKIIQLSPISYICEINN